MEPTAKKGTALILEADQGMQNLMGLYLRKIHYDIVVVDTWNQSFIDRLLAGEFAVAIVDWRSKVHASQKIFQQIRSHPKLKTLPIIFISGQVTRQDILATGQDSLTKFVIKPFTEDLLFRAIRELFKKKVEVINLGGGGLQIHRGEKPASTGGPDIIKGTPTEKKSLSDVPLNSEFISDIDVDEEPEDHEGVYRNRDNSLTYSRRIQKDAASFDYRKMQKPNDPKGPKTKLDILIIDDDASTLARLKKHLVDEKADMVEFYGNGDEGLEALKNRNYHLVIMAWTCPGIRGIRLFNLIRSHSETQRIPILVLADRDEESEKDRFRILEDRNYAQILAKDFDTPELETCVDLVRKIGASDFEAKRIVVEVIDKNRADKKKMLHDIVKAAKGFWSTFEIYLAAGQYLVFIKEELLALKIFEAASRIDPENVKVMTETAKLYLRMNRPTGSLQLLALASRFSPDNISWLCQFSEAGVDLFDTEEARNHLKSVLEVTGTDFPPELKQKPDLDGFLAHQRYKSLKEHFASTLNLVGITLIKNGQLERGVELYLTAMAFIEQGSTLGKLQFNLGLAYHRLGNSKLAIEWLETSLRTLGGDFPKATTWIARIRKEAEERRKMFIKDPNAIDWDSRETLDALADGLASLFSESA